MSGFENKKVENSNIDYSGVVVSSDVVGVYSNSVMNLNETEAIDIDNMGSAPELYIKSDDWMFGEKDAKEGQFGGNQGALTYNASIWLKDKKVRQIVDKYYPDATDEDLDLLFFRMNSCGCGYIAVVNTIMQATEGMEDFQERFGFQQYTLSFDSNGAPYTDYNYEYLFLDIFLYYAKNREGYETIEEVYGNAADERRKASGDAALEDAYIRREGMKGSYLDNVGEILEKYASERGINLKFEKPMIDSNSEDWDAAAKKLYEDCGVVFEKGKDQLYYTSRDLTPDRIKKYFEEGKQIIVDGSYFDVYYPYDKDGNGKLDDIVYEDVGGHAMYVVGTTSEGGKIVVSSWGHEYVVDINQLSQFRLYYSY